MQNGFIEAVRSTNSSPSTCSQLCLLLVGRFGFGGHDIAKGTNRIGETALRVRPRHHPVPLTVALERCISRGLLVGAVKGGDCVHRLNAAAGFASSHTITPGAPQAAALASGIGPCATVAAESMVSLHEPLLTMDSAVTVAQGPIPEANAAAWVGLPGVIVWELAKPAAA